MERKSIAARLAAAGIACALSGGAAAQTGPFTDLWWNAAESGWGINLNHQADTIFATWFTYSSANRPSWYVMSNLARQADGSFTGPIYQTVGVPLAQIDGAPTTRAVSSVGNATLRFSGNGAGTFTYTVAGTTQTKSITRQQFVAQATTCTQQAASASRAASRNYQDLWWVPAESGWGINLAHQGDLLFATWFTYGADGQPEWIVAPALARQPDGSFAGSLYRTTGTPFEQIAGTAATRSVTPAGSLVLRFQDGERGTLLYMVDGASRAKSIVRQVFGGTVNSCAHPASTNSGPPPITAGTDTRTLGTIDLTSRLSMAGTWIPFTTATGGFVGPFWNVVKTGAAQREGVALGGWVFNGSFTSAQPDVTPVQVAILEQQPNGTLQEASARLLGNVTTNGQGSVIVADFNGDGRDDLVFPAHNESPFLWKASTAWMSRADGGFDRITLPDAVMNHDARVVTIDGAKKILARSFGGSGNNGNGPGFNVLYSWNGSNFTVQNLGDLGGQSVLAGLFNGPGETWMIIGDSQSGPGVPYAPTNPMLNFAYRFSGGQVSEPPTQLPKPYFNDKPQYAGFRSHWDPYSKTHTSRLWMTDLNMDGRPDILAGQEIWTAESAGLQKAVFQLLVNRGNMAFEDQTDALAPEFSQDSIIDYNVRLADVDGSGIDTMFLSSPQEFDNQKDAVRQGQYVLVNDGTGRLYAALHDEFRAMRTQVAPFLQRQLSAGSGFDHQMTPQYIAYRTAAGRLNFVAVIGYFSATPPNGRIAFVNVALEVDLATDFRRDLTIPTRNGSRRIRTFAGNDTIARALADPDCAIDGGLGVNTAVYPGARSTWTIQRSGGTVTIRPASGGGGADTLTRVQRAVFDDQVVHLTSL